MTDAAPAIVGALTRLRQREDLDPDTMAAAMAEIMAGVADASQIGGLLMGLAVKGESAAEIVGAARAMRSACVPVVTQRQQLLDTCGTGGSGVARPNVSTAVAITVAACGVAVAKHGNRAVTGTCGSADVLEHLGVALDATPAGLGAMLDEIGLAFLFAPALHPALRHAAPVRRALGVRTLFNLLGPLCNPAGATRQLLGVYDPARCRELALASADLGSTRVIVVHGFREGVTADERAPAGIDDASVEGETLVWELRSGEVTRRVVHPRDAGLDPVSLAALGERLVDLGPAANAEAVLELFEGKPGPYRAAVQWSGALALLAAGDADWSELPGFARQIGDALDDGRARSMLADLGACSEQWSAARSHAIDHPPEPPRR